MSYQLTIDIQSYWHPGTGRGQGSHVDAVAHRDTDGLPVLPGKTVKGLLRDAVTRWGSFNQAESKPSLAEQLFGPDADAEEKWSGLLRVSDAVLPADVRYYLKKSAEENDGNNSLIPGLYQTLHATAIEQKTGTAVNKSLRGIEVVVPLTLYATLDEVPGVAYKVEDWAERMHPALSLIQGVGAHRSRGLGRAVVALSKLEGKS